jgi:N-dimethylarginine dimethylaminohydrolase
MADLKRVAHVPAQRKSVMESPKKSKVQFTDNKWADILNETDAISDPQPTAMNSFKDIMNEGMEEIRMTSRDAVNFGAMRQNMKEAMGVAPAAPKIMEDPETGKTFDVPQEVQQAMTRDYSALMKAINKKKGM